ncbi:nucleoside hydrolase-like domain-containing protein [Paenibacillus ferrarius]|uniref:nucleoside hydrolase-like domain-containing protein n=1 Tax=Paenibacillus ferrarius TaxID=1469647 RepID=UPI003D27BF38
MQNLLGGALNGYRYRVLISTDIGGSDPDDFQSMVHYLVYSDLFDTEGLISSPWGDGRTEQILEVIAHYEQDYPTLIKHSDLYPHPDMLRTITKQGAVGIAPFRGYSRATEGSDWIIHCARKRDSRPLYILIWGLLEDLAQALHDAPDIEDKLRVYYIGGPNKKWGLNAYEYIRMHFPKLWMIENNSTYRGWFIGGNQDGDLGNQCFTKEHIKGHGALGHYFSELLGGVIKMGDTPSVAYLLNGIPEIPENSGWGGCFTRVKFRPKFVFERNTVIEDKIEVFGVLELVFQGPDLGMPDDRPVFTLQVQNQHFDGFHCGDGQYKVRFMPKTTGTWSYATTSAIEELNNHTGSFTCVEESEDHLGYDPQAFPNWWSDMIGPDEAVGPHKGAASVSRWRELFLRDFQQRMDRCLPKNS